RSSRTLNTIGLLWQVLCPFPLRIAVIPSAPMPLRLVRQVAVVLVLSLLVLPSLFAQTASQSPREISVSGVGNAHPLEGSTRCGRQGPRRTRSFVYFDY